MSAVTLTYVKICKHDESAAFNCTEFRSAELYFEEQKLLTFEMQKFNSNIKFYSPPDKVKHIFRKFLNQQRTKITFSTLFELSAIYFET